MNQLRRRFIFDIILSILLIIEMFFELTGDIPHEILGCIFFITIIAHLILSKKWMSVTARQISSGKKMKLANKLRLVLAIGLAISFIVLVVSSIAISILLINITGINLAGSARETWIIIHTVSSYALCAFTIAHVLVHWASIFSTFKIPYNPARRQAINTGASAIVAVSAIALGVAANNAVDGIINPQLSQQPQNNASTEEAPSTTPTTPTAPQATEQPPARSGKKGNRAAAPENSAELDYSQKEPESTTPESPSTSQQDNTSSEIAYCPLCRLHCPLSAPQCNKPYQAGLL